MTGLKTAAPLGRRRGVPAAALLAGSAAVAVTLLSGCSAGKVTQTANIVPPLTGVDGYSNDEGRTMAVRDVMIAYPGPAGYRAGDTVPLLVRVFNNRVDGPPVKLTGVTVREGGNVVLVGPPPVAGLASGPAAGSAAASASGSPSGHAGSAGPTPSAVTKRSSATASSSPASPPSPSASTPAPSASPLPGATPGGGSAAFTVAVPAGGYVLLLPETGSYLAVTGLSRDLTAKDSLTLTFQFDNGLSIEVSGVRIGVPASPASRAPGAVNESER